MPTTKNNLIFIYIILISLLFATSAFAEPKIVFEEETHDFGEIEQMTANAYTFKFKNEGDEELVIKEVKTSCGCTAALLTSKNIKPGESGDISVTFNSGKFKNKVKKTIYVETNEKEKPVKTLFIQSFVKFDKEKEEALEKARREYQMKQSQERALAKEKSMELEKKQAQGISAPVANQPTNVAPQKPLPISAQEISIDFYPRNINLGRINLNQEYNRTIKIINLSQSNDVSIKKVEIQIPYVGVMINKLSVLPNSPGEISVNINVKSPGVLTQGILYVYVNPNALSAPIEIPISWSAE